MSDRSLTLRWLTAVALPAAATISLLYLASVIESPEIAGWLRATALTFLVITCCAGPSVYWAGRTVRFEQRYEDEAADRDIRIRQLKRDHDALSHALAAHSHAGCLVVGGYNPPVATPPPLPPGLRLVRGEG